MTKPKALIPIEPAEKLTVLEAAKLLGIGVNEYRAAIDRGEVPGHRIGGCYHVYREAVARFVRGEPGCWDSRTVEQTAERAAAKLAGELPASPFLRRLERLQATGD